ncbi:hypothetical protein SmedWSM1115_33645 (plasmid) [Sinorhizobium medicae WSM1115]|nr:hypothetical protein SmedWSM1115_33645 [Sinorhizobium medicae WSM1115]
MRHAGIKLEVIGNHDTLQPDVFSSRRLAFSSAKVSKPFRARPTIWSWPNDCWRPACKVLMLWCAPIGSAAGPLNPTALRAMRAHFPDVSLIVVAGIGRPSHATAVMELGFDAVLLNTAVAGAGDPAAMAAAFAAAIAAGNQAFNAGLLEPRDMAVSSTPVIGKAVFTCSLISSS